MNRLAHVQITPMPHTAFIARARWSFDQVFMLSREVRRPIVYALLRAWWAFRDHGDDLELQRAEWRLACALRARRVATGRAA